jgi:hypothetical protein
MVKVVPTPGMDFRSTVPPICSMLARTTSMPTPRPEILVILAAVEKPGIKIRLPISLSDFAAASASLASPCSTALARIRAISRPRPSSAISMMMWPP